METFWFTIYGYLKKPSGAVDFDHTVEKENIRIKARTIKEAKESALKYAQDYFSKDERVSIIGVKRQTGKH